MSNQNEHDIYRLFWSGKVVPKGRPRLGRNGVYMPPKYFAMKRAATFSFKEQWGDLGFVDPLDYQVRPYVLFIGKHNRSGDIVDNAPGTIYDALVEANVIKDDSGMWCPSSFHDLAHSKEPPRVEIFLAPALPFVDTLEQFAAIIECVKNGA